MLAYTSNRQKPKTREGKRIFMEEKMIQDFVHRASQDEELRKELASDLNAVITREGFSPRVARVIAQLVPQLALDQSLEPSFSWWRT